MNAIHIEPLPLRPAITFKAWRIASVEQGNLRREAVPIDLPEGVLCAEDAARAVIGREALYHKQTVLVLLTNDAERPERRHLLTAYRVKKRATRGQYEVGPDGQFLRDSSGKMMPKPECYPDLQFEVCVHGGFDPVRPWKVEDGNPGGADLTLVEG